MPAEGQEKDRVKTCYTRYDQSLRRLKPDSLVIKLNINLPVNSIHQPPLVKVIWACGRPEVGWKGEQKPYGRPVSKMR